jgi:hypothetical protein
MAFTFNSYTYIFCGSSNHMQSIVGWLDVHALKWVTDNINSLHQHPERDTSETWTNETLKAVSSEQCPLKHHETKSKGVQEN